MTAIINQMRMADGDASNQSVLYERDSGAVGQVVHRRGAEVVLTVSEIEPENSETTKTLPGPTFVAWKGIEAEELKKHIYESRRD